MKPIKFDSVNAVFGANQPEYQPLPARIDDNRVVSCWELTPEEIKTVQETGKIWLSILTFNTPLQPVLLTVDEPKAINNE